MMFDDESGLSFLEVNRNPDRKLSAEKPSRWRSDPETVIALMLLVFVIVAAFKLLVG